jgi:hypothetical protein
MLGFDAEGRNYQGGSRGALLALVVGLGWWGYRAVKKSDLQRNTLALVQDSTVLLREALGLVAAGSEIRGRSKRASVSCRRTCSACRRSTHR